MRMDIKWKAFIYCDFVAAVLPLLITFYETMPSVQEKWHRKFQNKLSWMKNNSHEIRSICIIYHIDYSTHSTRTDSPKSL